MSIASLRAADACTPRNALRLILATLILAASALGGCMTSVRRIVPSARLDTAEAPIVRSVRLQDGRQILFRGDGEVVATDSGLVVVGVVVEDTTVHEVSAIRRERIAEAVIDVGEPSFPHSWALLGSAIVIAAVIVLSGYRGH